MSCVWWVSVWVLCSGRLSIGEHLRAQGGIGGQCLLVIGKNFIVIFGVRNYVKGYEFVRNDSKCCWCWYCRENIIRILIKMDVRQNLN